MSRGFDPGVLGRTELGADFYAVAEAAYRLALAHTQREEREALPLADIVRLLKCVQVLDCGAHYCRYCSAKSPDWEHGAWCPYVQSQRENDEALKLARRLEAALPPAPDGAQEE